MRSCEASRFVPTSCGSGKEAAVYCVEIWNNGIDGDSGNLIKFPPVDTICVIARLRLLASRDCAATAQPTRSIFCGENYLRGIFSAKPEGLECGGFGYAVIFYAGASRSETEWGGVC